MYSLKIHKTATPFFQLFANEAGGMFHNSYFDNSFDLFRQFKIGLFKVHFLVHKKLKLALIKYDLGPDYVQLMLIMTFFIT
jgi:hypothetical protein